MQARRQTAMLLCSEGDDGPVELTHFDEAGRAHMVDISEKAETAREAIAAGSIRMRRATLARIREGSLHKGDVLAVAQVAGILAAKQTPQIIPMCHSIALTGVDIAFELDDGADGADDAGAEDDTREGRAAVHIRASVRTVGKTGAEMEALTAVSATALTIYDMCKAVDRAMSIEHIRLLRKSGGKSGIFEREDEEAAQDDTRS